MKEVFLDEARCSEAATFAACVATILELPLAAVPVPEPGQDPAKNWAISRWLGGMGLGLAAVADPTFSRGPGHGWRECNRLSITNPASW